MIGEEALETVLSAESHDERTHENDTDEGGPTEIVDLGDESVEIGSINDLVLVVKGEVVETNFQQVAKQIKGQVAQINEDLKSDSDFKNATTIAKSLRAATKKMSEVKANALAEAEDLYATFKAIDDVSETCSLKARKLEKLIADRKAERKKELLESADYEINEYMRSQSEDFQNQRYTNEVYSLEGLNACVKNKKSFDVMEELLDAYVAESKQRADDLVSAIEANAALLEAVEDDYKDLFLNRVHLLGMTSDLLKSTIEQYIQTHKANELQRQIDEQAEKDRLAEAETQRLADIQAAADLAETELESMVDDVQQNLNDDALVSVEHTATSENLDDDDDLSILDNPNVVKNETSAPQARKVDNRPPSGFGGGARPSVSNTAPQGSPVPVVKKSPEPETVAEPVPADENLVGCYEMTIGITAKLARAQEIAKIAHGRLKNMPEVQRVGLRDTSKPSKLIKTIIDELRASNEHRAVNQIQRILEKQNNG